MTLHAAGAVRAGAPTGRVHIFGYYQDALDAIASEGLADSPAGADRE